MQKSAVFLFLAFSLFLVRCALEEARVPTQRELVIASDYLSKEDSVLFRKFSQVHEIEVRIVHLDARAIYSQLLEEGSESEIDLILLESESDVHRLAVAELLQVWPTDFNLARRMEKYASTRYHFVGYALDPYCITASAGSTISTYNDLLHEPFSDELSKADRINMLAPVWRKLDKAKTEEWLFKFSAQGQVPSSEKDTILTVLPRLMKRSTYHLLKAGTSSSRMPSMRILNSGKKGSFYNLRTFCMASQCSNSREALTFAKYFLKPGKNEFLSEQLHLVPATNPGKVFRPYIIRTEELLSLHTLVERTLGRISR